MPILNRIMVAGGLLGIAIVAVLYAQSPGLFSTLEVDSTTRLRDTLQVDGALTLTLEDQIAKRDIAAAAVGQGQLDTGTGTSTGAGRRTVAQPEYAFAPALSGDPFCAVLTTPNGWGISNAAPGQSQWGQYLLTSAQAPVTAIDVDGSDLWTLRISSPNIQIWRASMSNPSGGTLYRTIDTGTSTQNLSWDGLTVTDSDIWVLEDQGRQHVFGVSQRLTLLSLLLLLV